MTIPKQLICAFFAGLVSLFTYTMTNVAHSLDILDVPTRAGAIAWMAPVPSVPVIAVELSFSAGVNTEPADKRGLRTTVADMLNEGAGDLNSQAFQAQAERLGIYIQARPNRDFFRIGMTAPSIHAAEAFRLLNLAMTSMRVEQTDLDRVIARNVASVKRRTERPKSRASHALMEAIYPGHPYGEMVRGTLDGLKAVKANDVKAYALDWLTIEGLVIGLVADFDEQQAGEYLDVLLSGLTIAQPSSGSQVKDVTPAVKTDVQILAQDVPQSAIQFALPAVTRNHPDWLPLVLTTRIAGGASMTSRLFANVRRDRGLAYSVGLSALNFLHSGVLMGYTGTANESVGITLGVIRETLANLAQNGPSKQELADAKTNLIGSLPLALDTNEALADMLVHMQVYDMGRDYLDRRADLISAVTMKDVKRVAQRYMNPNHMTVVVVGAPEGM